MPDPNWFSFLKPGSDVVLAMTLACLAALAALHFGLFTAPWAWLNSALWLGLIAGICLTAIGMLGSYLKHRN